MASLRDGFEHFYGPDDDAVAETMRTGLVSTDANVLLTMYRYQPGARDDLFGALEIVSDRLWLAHQAALEFHRNRLGVIAAQDSYFSKTGSELDTAFTGYLEKLKAFAARIALPQAVAQELEDRIQKAHEAVKAQVSDAGMANEVHLDNRDSDEVLRRIEALFTNRVGEPMKPDELDAARKEAKRRIDAKIPPGYMDKDKTDPYGDYLLFRQLMTEAAARKLPTILITDDRKEDWFWREHGLTLGARYELREEMAREAGVPFSIMSTATFLVQAEKYLKASVSPATVDQAKVLPARLVTETEQKYQARLYELHERRAEVTARITLAEQEMATLEAWRYDIINRNNGEPSDEQDLIEVRELERDIASLRSEITAARDTRKTLDARLNDVERFMRDQGFGQGFVQE